LPAQASTYIGQLIKDVTGHRSLPELKKLRGTLHKHNLLTLNHFNTKEEFPSGIAEGFKTK